MPGILLVDDDASFLESLFLALKDRGYEITTAASGHEAIEKIKSNFFDLIIADIRMPGFDGIDTLAGAREKQPDLRGILVTGYQSSEDPIRAIKHRVDDYFVKPFDMDELLASVERSIKELKAANYYKDERKKIRDDFILTVKQIALAIEGRDPYYSGHSQNVASYAIQIGKERGLSKGSLENLEIASYLHDLGQVEIQQAIIQKRGVLSGMEYEEIKKHPVFARNLLQAIPRFQSVIDIIFYHHEKFDGTGYPVGLKGNDIQLESRILSLAEAYSSLLELRPHRDAFSPEEALAILQKESGTSFDPSLIEILIRCIEKESEEYRDSTDNEMEEELTQDKQRRAALQVGMVFLEMGQLLEARQAFEKCLHLDEERDDAISVEALRGLAAEAMASGEVEKARKHVAKAEKYARKSNSYQQALILVTKSAISIKKGASSKALAMLSTAEEIFSKWGARGERARTLLYRARARIGDSSSPSQAGMGEFQHALGEALEIIGNYSHEGILMAEMEISLPLLCRAFFRATKIRGVKEYLLLLGKRNPRMLAMELLKAGEKHILLFLKALETEPLEEFGALLTSLRESPYESVRSRAAHLSTRISGAETAAMNCRACCLGNFTFFAGTSLLEDRGWKTLKSRYLLAYFLLHWQERIQEERIFDAFWSDAAPQKARRSLNTAINQVRQMFEPLPYRTALEIISHDKESYFLNPEVSLSLDVRDFSRFCDRGFKDMREGEIDEGIGSLQRAESLYTGDLLDGYCSDWVEERRKSLRLKYGEILIVLMRHFYEKHGYEVCLEYSRKMLSLDNCHEMANSYQIKSHLGLGNRKDAMAACQSCVEVMERELGMEPPLEIQEIMLALK
jgi:putative two-component system response regulator